MNALNGAESIEEYYQLSHDPFAARTPGFKFFTPQRKTVLAQLHHLAQFGDRVLLVSGPQGSGKTLLRQVLVASSNKDTTQCVVTTAREFSTGTALTSFLCQAVNATGRDSSALLLRAEQLRETGVNLYLIVDDAQLLERAALQELVELSRIGWTDSPLRIFLFADESIQPALDQVDAEEEGEQWLHLIPLQSYTLEETRDYIAQRLDAAGQGIELLDDEQIQWIHRHSGGWPGRINDAARQSMRDAMAEQDPPAAARVSGLPFKSLIAVVLVATGIGFAWFMGDRQQEPVSIVLELPEPIVPAEAGEDLQLAELTELNALPGVAPTVNLFPESEVSAALDAEAVAPASAMVSAAAEPSAAEPVAQRPDPAAAVPAPEQEQPPAQSPASPAAAGPEESGSAIHSAAWYIAGDPGRYVLQVLGSQRKEAAKAFIADYPGVADLGFFETTHQGKPWFVVTQGNYPGRQQAQQGVSRLPESMRRGSPWPRSISDIQQALN